MLHTYHTTAIHNLDCTYHTLLVSILHQQNLLTQRNQETTSSWQTSPEIHRSSQCSHDRHTCKHSDYFHTGITQDGLNAKNLLWPTLFLRSVELYLWCKLSISSRSSLFQLFSFRPVSAFKDTTSFLPGITCKFASSWKKSSTILTVSSLNLELHVPISGVKILFVDVGVSECISD